MSLEGTVVNGVIVLDGGEQLPEGTRIKVVVTPTERQRPTLESLADLAGGLDGLPPDFAGEHDHYLHGTPRKRPESE